MKISFAVGATLLLTELLAAVAIRVVNPRVDGSLRHRRAILTEQSERIAALLEADSNRVLELDSMLGWRYRRNRADSINGSNSWGARGRREYTARPRSGVIRVAAYGDSFTYGNEVADRDSWPALVEQFDPDLEVLNFGVGGYGADQAYLRFRSEGSAHGSQVALLGFAPDDLGRLVNVYRRFRSSTELPLFKPRFVEQSDGSLELLPNPALGASFYERLLREPTAVTEVGAQDAWFERFVYVGWWYDRSATVRLVAGLWSRVRRRFLDDDRLMRGETYNIESPAFRIQVRVFQLFADSARARGQRPLVVFLPDKWTIEQVRAGRPPVYAPLVETLRKRGIPVADAATPFQGAESAAVDAWFRPGGHYSPEGNRVVADWLRPGLRSVALAPQGPDTR